MKSIHSEKSISQEYFEFLESVRDKVQSASTSKDTEKDKEIQLEKIRHKLEAGEKLTAKEMSFLKKYYPELYLKALKIQRFREAFKQELKKCRTKEEAQRVIASTYASVGEKDPDRDALLAAIGNVTKQYLNSHAYKSLPDNAEQLKKSKKPSDLDDDMFKEDEESDKDEDFELSYSIDSTGYQEATIENDSDVTFSA